MSKTSPTFLKRCFAGCYAFWCCPCFACSTAKRFGERRCFPLLDILTPALMTAAGIPLCVPPAGLALRVAIRHTYGIKVCSVLSYPLQLWVFSYVHLSRQSASQKGSSMTRRMYLDIERVSIFSCSCCTTCLLPCLSLSEFLTSCQPALK